MAPSAALTSDHVNYLIFRYLQEAGHGSTATAFYRDWRRNAEFSNPEDYPFATVVHSNELVKVIQSGLQLDELQSRVRKDPRRFRFTLVNSTEVDRGLENGTAAISAAGSRPGSSAKRKGRAPVARAQDEFPTPAPKRQRRSEERQVNGDSMDVDVPAASPAADADDDGDAASPALVSEPEMMEVPERYDSMDVAVQTETKAGPKTSTMSWSVNKPGANIYRSMFNPCSVIDSPTLGRPHTLLTVGEHLCRFYQVPENMETTTQVLSIDEPTLPLGALVTAAAWHPNGHIAAFAADTARDVSDGKQASEQKIFSHDSNTGKYLQYLTPPLLEPQGIVLELRYNDPGDRLLALRSDLGNGVVFVYNTAEDALADHAMPIAWVMPQHHPLDVAWITPTDFLIVGRDELAQSAHLKHGNDATMNGSLTAADMQSFGVTIADIDLSGMETKSEALSESVAYDRVRVGPARTTFTPILLTKDNSYIIVTQAESSAPVAIMEPVTQRSSRYITAVAFQPVASREDVSTLFAVARDDGYCELFSYLASPAGGDGSPEKERLRELGQVTMKHGPALALAWSPDGSHLAVAGVDLVHVWAVDALLRRSGERFGADNNPSPDALFTWRPDGSALERRNGDHENASKPLSEPSLSWSANGHHLAFAVDREVAVIRFTPPLTSREEKDGMNGHVSP